MIDYNSVKIINLNESYVKRAIKLVMNTFEDEGESIKKELWASVNEEKLIKYIKKYDRHMRTLEYFIAIDSEKNLLGIIGLYSLNESYENTYWLGWYCVSKRHRGKGIGKLLLDYAIETARERGKSYLCLYTSTDENEAKAQEIYEKNGFYITKRIKKHDYEILYREKVL